MKQKDVERLIFDELNEAKEKFPPFNSKHEGYAVLLEEIEEAEFEMSKCKECTQEAWSKIKSNLRVQVVGQDITRTRYHAVKLAMEAIQIAAMCERFKTLQKAKGGGVDVD